MAEAPAIGIDLGGTQVRAAVVEGARVLARAAEPTDAAGGPAAVLGQIERLMEQVLPRSAWSGLAGLGVSAPGPLDTDTGTVLNIPTLPGWDGLPLRDLLAERTGLPVVLENDGIAAAFGEWRHGAGQGLRHLVYVTVSTGIGGGVVVDGRLLHGRRGMAGHVGHLLLDPAGPPCSCGALGCFEAHAAGPALGRAARALAPLHPGSGLAALAPRDELTAWHVAEAARREDRLALDLLAEEARHLGLGFTALIHLFSPEAVIMGGGVSDAFDLLEGGIRATIRARAMAAFREVPVIRAALGGNSGLIGAAALAAEAARL
jgi:glucokinase